MFTRAGRRNSATMLENDSNNPPNYFAKHRYDKNYYCISVMPLLYLIKREKIEYKKMKNY